VRDALREALGTNGSSWWTSCTSWKLVLGPQPPGRGPWRRRTQRIDSRCCSGVSFARPSRGGSTRSSCSSMICNGWNAADARLLEHLVTHSEVPEIYCWSAPSGTTRSVPRTPSCARWRRFAMPARGWHEIVLAPLGLDDAGAARRDASACEPERALPLAQLVHEKRRQSVLPIQFFTGAGRRGTVAFNPVARAWQWDIDRSAPRATPTTWWSSWRRS